jgi:hypothetical protein
MIGELQQRAAVTGGRVTSGAVPGPVSPELLLFAPEPEGDDDDDNDGGRVAVNVVAADTDAAAWDWELVSHLLRAYQQQV